MLIKIIRCFRGVFSVNRSLLFQSASLGLLSVVVLLSAGCPLLFGGRGSDVPAVQGKPTTEYFWGHWVRMDQEEYWYVADRSVYRAATEILVASCDDVSLTAGGYDLDKESENVIRVNNGEFFLYRSRGAQGRLSGTVAVQGATTSRAVQAIGGNIGSVSMVIKNLRNPLNTGTVLVASDGSFSIDEIVPTDSYEISTTITHTDGNRSAGPSLEVTPKSVLEDIGTILLTDVAYNFKISVDVPEGFLYADGTAIPIIIKIRNIGTADSKGANFEFPAMDGITVTSSADPILGTIKPGLEKTIDALVSCPAIQNDYEDKLLRITIIDAYNNTWNDQVSIRFYKEPMDFSIASLNNPVFGVVMTPEKEGYWFTTVTAGGNRYEANLELPWRETGYLVALSRATVATESRYSLGIGVPAGTNTQIQALTRTGVYEINDLETQAAGIAHGEMIVAYLHDEDIDFYSVGGRASRPAATPAGGRYDTIQQVSLAALPAGTSVHYTLDGATPSVTSAIYTTPLTIDRPLTIKALALGDDLDTSAIMEESYSFRVARPLFSRSGSLWTINCATPGATIRFTTDLSDPGTSSPIYTPGTELEDAGGIFKARAWYPLWEVSELGASSGAPDATFTASLDTVKQGQEISFDASAVTDDDTTQEAIEVSWDFGDGSEASTWNSIKTTIYSYSNPGNYTVTLSARDKYGVIGTVTQTITVNASGSPVAAFAMTPSIPVIGQAVSFNASTTTDDDTDLADIEVRWDFNGDGEWEVNWTTAKTTSYTWDSEVDVTIILEVRDAFGFTDQASRAVTVLAVSPIPRNGLLAEYLFNGNAGDTSGNNNHGTASMAVLTANRQNQAATAFEFNGTTSLISANANAINMQFTISGWIKIDDPAKVNYLYSERCVHGNGGDDRSRVYLSRVATSSDPSWSNRVVFYIRTQSGAWNDYDGYYVITVNEFSSGWIHVVATRNNGDLRIWVNGILQATTVFSYGRNANNYQLRVPSNDRSLIGAAWTGTLYYGHGRLDDIRVYNRVLTSDEIASLYTEN